MKRNGFTLIELLAVIVILAIIALIATPIILGIINDAREKANERSVELYASAVRNGIAAYQLREGKEVTAATYNEINKLPFKVEYDGKVDCTNVIILEDGKVSLEGCTVNGGEKTYNYGIEDEASTACILQDLDSDEVASLSDIVICGTESFYVMSNKNEEITMLAKYNLNVGANAYTSGTLGIQNENVFATKSEYSTYGTVAFSTSMYWLDENYELLSQYGSSYPAYVYNENSNLYQYVSAYERILKKDLKVSSATASLVTYEQLEELECSGDDYSCLDAPSWVYSTSYWTGSVYTYGSYLWCVYSHGSLSDDAYGYDNDFYYGVRPVITISTSELK